MRFAILSLMLVLPASVAAKGESGEIRVVNRAQQPIYFAALELEDSHHVDPMPAFDSPEAVPFPRLEPGEESPVGPISEYSPGKSICLFIYTPEMDGGKLTGKVLFVKASTFSAAQIRRDSKLEVKLD